MESLVDWDKQGKWDSKESPAAIYNEIWRICMNDDAACDVVYQYIVNFVKFDESALCKHILYNDKYDKLFGDVTPNLIIMFGQVYDELIDMLDSKSTNVIGDLCKYNYDSEDIQGKKSYIKSYSFSQMDRNKLQSLYNVCQKFGLIGRLIYSQPILSVVVLSEVLKYLKELHFQQAPLVHPSNAMDRRLPKVVYGVIFGYCSKDDLLQYIFVNRYWHHVISEWAFVKQCRAFKNVILYDEQVDQYDDYYASRWMYQDCKILTILAFKETLENSRFCELDGTNIQVFESSYNYLIVLPQELKGLSILCDDYTLDTFCDYDHWDIFNTQQKALIFTVINYDPSCLVQVIPITKAILWNKSKVMTHLIVECIAKKTIEWIGLQQCGTISSCSKDKSDPKADYSEYIPSTKLAFIHSSNWIDRKRILDNYATYHKHVSDLTIVTDWDEIDFDTWDFWDFLIQIYNDKYAKKIVILFKVEDIIPNVVEDEHLDRISWVFGWTASEYNKIKKQVSIGEFTFGLISTGNNQERGHAFDIKKLDSQGTLKTYEKIWERILFTKKSIASTKLWLNKFNQVSAAIPRK